MAAKRKTYQPKHSSTDDPGPGTYKPKVAPNAPGKPGTPGGPGTNRRRSAQHLNPTPKAKPNLSGAALQAKKTKRFNNLVDESRDYAFRNAVQRTEGKPSVTGRAAAGAAAGTAAGAALGGPVGAAAGAVLGGTGGALAGAKAKKAYQLSRHASLGARRAVVAEFLICMVVVALSPLTDRRQEEKPGTFMRRMTAVMALFFILGLISTAGRGAGKVAAGFGGLVTVALVVSNRDLFVKLTGLFNADQGKAAGSAGKATGSAPKPEGETVEVVPEDVSPPERFV